MFSCELCGLFLVVGQGFRSAWEEVVMWVGRTTVLTGNQSVSQSVSQPDGQPDSQSSWSLRRKFSSKQLVPGREYALARRGEPVVADETTTKSLLLLSSLWWHAIV